MSKSREITIVYDGEGAKRKLPGIVFAALLGILFAVELFTPMNYYLVLTVCALVAVISSALIQSFFQSKWCKIGLALILVSGSAVIYVAFSKVWLNGGTIILNSIIESWNRKNGTMYYLYVTNDTKVEASVMLFSVSIFLVILIVLNLLIYTRFNGGVVLMNFLMFSYYVVGQAGNNLAVIITMVAVLVAYIVFMDSDRELIRKSKAYWCVLIVCVTIVTAVILVAIRLIPDNHVEDVRRRLVQEIEVVSFGASDLSDGDLTNIPNHKDEEIVRLQVTTECKDALYLKGFVGSVYTGNRWTDLDHEAYQGENKEMQQYLLENGYSPLTMLTMFIALSDGYDSDTFEVQEVSYKVENVSASSKYIYTPYTCQGGTFGYYDNVNKDLNVRNSIIEQKNVYEFSTLEIGVDEYLDLYNNGCLTDKYALVVNSKYLDVEQTYHEYVDKYYLEVPEELESYFDTRLDNREFEGVADTITYVRGYLKKDIVYSDKPEYKYSGSGDFIIELLEEDKQGYSVHYATAATMMLRYYGIPARYVEGYRRAATGVAETSLYTRNAHAWVEIYRYGMGWVPIEVTPGYYVETENQTLSAADQNITPPVTPPTPPVQDVEDGTNNNDSENGNPPPAENDAENWLHQLMKMCLWIMLIVGLLLLVIFIRRKVILYRQNKRIQSEDWKDSILFMATLTWRLCKRGGVPVDSARPDASVDEMNRLFKTDIKMDFSKFTEIIKRAKYSQEQKEEDDYIVVKAYMETVKNKVYKKASLGKKLRLKYLDVLY